jgi:hypothetical protein
MTMYRLEYDASTEGDGSMMVVWEKTLDELLMPNGVDSLLVWMLKETEYRGGPFTLTRLVKS